MHFPLFRVAENWRQVHGIATAEPCSIEASFWMRLRIGGGVLREIEQAKAISWHSQRAVSPLIQTGM